MNNCDGLCDDDWLCVSEVVCVWDTGDDVWLANAVINCESVLDALAVRDWDAVNLGVAAWVGLQDCDVVPVPDSLGLCVNDWLAVPDWLRDWDVDCVTEGVSDSLGLCVCD